MITDVKEAVDNAIDACEDAGILPELDLRITRRGRIYSLGATDNGPGILEPLIGRSFGKLLHGAPIHVLSGVEREALATSLRVAIDPERIRPDVHRKTHTAWDQPQDTRVEFVLERHLQAGRHSIATCLRRTAIANPHVTIRYAGPEGPPAPLPEVSKPCRHIRRNSNRARAG